MNIENLQRELQIAHYIWGIQKFRTEIENGFPLLSMFQTMSVPRLLVFLKNHSIEDQIKFANALVKRRSPEAVSALGETLTAQEQKLFELCLNAISTPTNSELNSNLVTPTSEVLSDGKKEQFKKAIIDELRPMFGEPHQKRTSVWWVYKTNIHGWTVETEIDIGSYRQINYSHNIALGTECLKQNVSILSLLGMSGQTDIDFKMTKVSSAPKILERLCRTYMNAASELFPQIR